MMHTLETVQRRIERLYHDVVINDCLAQNDDECICNECGECACQFLKDRIKKNLRMVLCDVVFLNHYEGDTLVEDF